MTSIITLSCPEGIVLAGDSRVIYPGGLLTPITEDNVRKICYIKKVNVAVSYWGRATFPELNGKKMPEFLTEFEDGIGDDDTMDTVSEKLKQTLEAIEPKLKDAMGIHVAGFVRGKKGMVARMRHIFHVAWLPDGVFMNEDSNREYHDNNGKKTVYPDYEPFIALFNGDNIIANAFFHFIPYVDPQRRQIILDRLTIAQCIKLASLVIFVSREILNYLISRDIGEKVVASVGGPIKVAKLTTAGFEECDVKNYFIE